MENPQITPFKYPSEFETLYRQLYSKRSEDQTFAVQKIRAYLTKGPIPHSIEVTALLVDARLSDTPGNDLSVRLKYSTCIVKFVNGLLDPFQQSLYNISLHKLAQDLKLPGYFVELRHACTHERLPSLQMLRMVAIKAIEWIKVQYWEVALREYRSRGMLSIDEKSWKRAMFGARKSWLKACGVLSIDDYKPIDETLKAIKKIRKSEIQENKRDRKIGPLIKSLKCDDLLIHCMIFRNVLILNKELTEKHMNGVKLMWSSVLETLDRSFLFKLWERLFILSTQKILVEHDDSSVEINYFQNEHEVIQAKEWVVTILGMKILNKENFNRFLELIMIDNNVSIRCMESFKTEYPNIIFEHELESRIEKMENIMQKFWVLDNSFKKRRRDDANDNDSETNELDNKTNKLKPKLFQTYSHWRPVPFGCIPPV